MIEDDSRQHVYNPWHFRDRIVPTRTYCGRVVYERPKHQFTMTDVERIVNKLEPPDEEDRGALFGRFDRVLRAIWRLGLGTAVSFPGQTFDSVFDYLSWAIRNSTSVLVDPVGALYSRTKELIISLADLVGIKIKFL